MKFFSEIDSSKKINLILTIMCNILVFLFSYSFFTRHIVHTHPRLFFIFLFIFSILFFNFWYKIKIFIPVKICVIMLFSFFMSMLMVCLFTPEYRDNFFEKDTILLLFFSFFGGFLWMKLYIVIPILSVVYLIILEFNPLKKILL